MATAPRISSPRTLIDSAALRWPAVASPVEPGVVDNRIAAAAAHLRAHPASSADNLAAVTNLPTSRFLRLFRARTGTSFRRFRPSGCYPVDCRTTSSGV